MNEMVRKLNALGIHDAQIGVEATLKLALMRVKTQMQNDGSRFNQALGRTTKASSWQGQAEWEQSGAKAPNWKGQASWESAGNRQRAKDQAAGLSIRLALSKPL